MNETYPDLSDLLGRHGKNHFFPIAEAGTNHNGSLETAKAMVDAASRAGASAIKFQYVIAEEILHPKTGLVKLPGGSIPLFERFRELECPPTFYRDLKDYAAGKGIVFLCTPFGPGSAYELEKIGVPAYKIASPEVGYFPLLKSVAEFGKPMFVSTGVTQLADLVQTRDFLNSFPRIRDQFTFLHCITEYPAPENEYNLLLLATLRFLVSRELPIGLSDHTLDAFFLPKVAYVLCRMMGQPLILEKHLTLDKKGTGLDDPIAVDEKELGELTRQIGDLSKHCEAHFLKNEAQIKSLQKECEEILEGQFSENGFSSSAKIFLRLKSLVLESITPLLPEYPAERISAALGNGVKQLAASEAGNYLYTRRSLRAKMDIRAGEVLSEKNCLYLRSEKNLTPGIFPEPKGLPAGAKAARDIKDGEAITGDGVILR